MPKETVNVKNNRPETFAEAVQFDGDLVLGETCTVVAANVLPAISVVLGSPVALIAVTVNGNDFVLPLYDPS